MRISNFVWTHQFIVLMVEHMAVPYIARFCSRIEGESIRAGYGNFHILRCESGPNRRHLSGISLNRIFPAILVARWVDWPVQQIRFYRQYDRRVFEWRLTIQGQPISRIFSNQEILTTDQPELD